MTEADMIIGCKRGDRKSQKILYEKYARRMMTLCLRYGGDRERADDFLQEGFIRVFAKIGEYTEEGTLEGWIRRVFVNCALMQIRRDRLQPLHESLEEASNEIIDALPVAQMTADELLEMVRRLPVGYRTVFNLYAIEGYAHNEIADLLSITEETSRSQYARARQALQKSIRRFYEM